VLELDVIRSLGATAMTEDIAIGMTESGLPNPSCRAEPPFLHRRRRARLPRGARRARGRMCETDFSGYPDCRDDTLKALQVALGLGMDRRFTIETPLMWIDKAATFAMAEELGGQPSSISSSNTPTPAISATGERHRTGEGLRARMPCVQAEKRRLRRLHLPRARQGAVPRDRACIM